MAALRFVSENLGMTYENYSSWKTDAVGESPDLSVVIPAYNEAQRIVPTIAAIAAHLSSSVNWAGESFEIIVSDDGSTDGTVALVRLLGLRNVRVLSAEKNQGKGAAVAAGVRAATGSYVLITDADLSTPISHIDEMFDVARTGVPVVIGSRGLDDATEANKSGLRRTCSSTLRWLTKKVLGSEICDTQCGFKLFEQSAASDIFTALRSNDFSFDMEALWLANSFGYEVVELPVTWFDAPGSTVRPFRAAASFLRQLVRLRVMSTPTPTENRPPASFGVVTALPPSPTTLNEYGFHLTGHLANTNGVDDVIAFHEAGHATLPSGVRGVGCWTFNSILTPFHLLAAIRRERPDAVLFNIHFTAFGNDKIAAGMGLLSPALVRLSGVPTVVLLHNLVDTVDLQAAGFGSHSIVERALRSIGFVLTKVLLRADRVVTTMPNYVDILREGYGADNVYLTPHGSFEETPWRGSEPANGGRRILAFGKFGTYKRVEGLLEAYRSLVTDPAFENVELVIAGTDSPNAVGYLAEIEATTTDLPGVSFTGYVEEEDVEALFESASVVVFPYTSTTGSSGPLHQAGAFGRPVVIPEVGDFIGLVEEEGFAGVPFDPASPDSLCAALSEVMANPQLRAEHGAINHAAANSLPLADIATWHQHHLVAAASQ